MEYTIYNDDCLKKLDELEENSIDSIVTDPPYELNFMGKGWDNAGVSFQKSTWEKCLRVLKPGGYLLAFGGSRTFHRIACAIEDAGFEIRDTIMWLYGSGFPKSMDIEKAINKRDGVKFRKEQASGVGFMNTKNDGYHNTEHRLIQEEESSDRAKQWHSWGTSLKPSFEPIIVARKPLEGTCIDNVLKYGTGAFNIDECRVGDEYIKGGTMPDLRDVGKKSKEAIGIDKLSFGQVENANRLEYEGHNGRFPANTILTYDEDSFDEVCGGFPTTKKNGSISKPYKINNQVYGDYGFCNTWEAYNDSGSACRYFYNAKASKKDRNDGVIKNGHPCVKPTLLMQYLVRLVTKTGGAILDPFMGSGSTGKAIAYENNERNANYKFIGIEMSKEYCDIARARIEYAINDKGDE